MSNTFTKRMTDYIFLKRDICCDEDYNKDKIIDYLINNYKKYIQTIIWIGFQMIYVNI